MSLFPPPSSPVPPPATTHSTPRLLCDLQVEGTGLLSRLQQLCCRCLFRVLARHHQARHPALHVCVCMHMSACVYICVIYTICNIYLIICTCVCVCVCIKRISSKYNVICVERYGYSCLSSLSLIRSVYVHVFMYACMNATLRVCARVQSACICTDGEMDRDWNTILSYG